ncbi:MAG: hypothetical protein R2807_09235 [Chitinophagales bacterium]
MKIIFIRKINQDELTLASVLVAQLMHESKSSFHVDEVGNLAQTSKWNSRK